jgi:hypothetical protein
LSGVRIPIAAASIDFGFGCVERRGGDRSLSNHQTIRPMVTP